MMGAAEINLAAARALRDATKLELDTHLAQVKLDLQERGIAGRVADEVVERAKIVFDEAADVVQDNPGVIGGTIAALMLWLLRNPIIAWIEARIGSNR